MKCLLRWGKGRHSMKFENQWYNLCSWKIGVKETKNQSIITGRGAYDVTAFSDATRARLNKQANIETTHTRQPLQFLNIIQEPVTFCRTHCPLLSSLIASPMVAALRNHKQWQSLRNHLLPSTGRTKNANFLDNSSNKKKNR